MGGTSRGRGEKGDRERRVGRTLDRLKDVVTGEETSSPPTPLAPPSLSPVVSLGNATDKNETRGMSERSG